MAMMRRTFRNLGRPWWWWRALANRRARIVNAPELNFLAAVPADTTASLWTVTSERGAGTIWAVVVPAAADAPDASQVKAGTDGADGAATWDGSKAVAVPGGHALAVTGLTAETAYMAYAVYERTADSAFSAVAARAFTTTA